MLPMPTTRQPERKIKNNPSVSLKGTLLRISITRKNKDLNCYIFFTSELLGRFRFETKNAKKGTDNGFPRSKNYMSLYLITQYSIIIPKKSYFGV
jgi:hypothetical protein